MFNKWLNNIFTNQKGESFTVLELVKKLNIEVTKVIAQVEENKVLTEETKQIVDAINLIVVDVENRMSGLETDMAEYKVIMGDMYETYTTNMNTAFSTFKNETNADITLFKSDTNADIQDFKDDVDDYRLALTSQMSNLQENMNALTVVSGVGAWKNTPNNFAEVFNDYNNNFALAGYSHAGGYGSNVDNTSATGAIVHGYNLKGSKTQGSAVFGRNNDVDLNTDTQNAIFMVGNGTGGPEKDNAFYITENNNPIFKKPPKVQSTKYIAPKPLLPFISGWYAGDGTNKRITVEQGRENDIVFIFSALPENKRQPTIKMYVCENGGFYADENSVIGERYEYLVLLRSASAW